MTRPVEKLMKSATFVIWASQPERGGLTLGEKVVWYHTWGLDQESADACYMGDQSLSDRLGLKIRTIQQLRYRLRALGLLMSFKRVEGDNLGWVAVLPTGCTPSTPRAAGKESFELAKKLDSYLKAKDPARATRVAEKAMSIASDRATASPSSLSSRKNPVVLLQSEAQLPPSVTSTEEGVVAKATRTTRRENKDLSSSEQLGIPEIELRMSVIQGERSSDPVIRAAVDELKQRLEETA